MMNISEFEEWILIAHSRLEKMEQNLLNLSPESLNILAELSINLEELHVATEELYLRNQELLRSRQQVELERQRYVNLFDLAPHGYFVTDAEAIIQEANRSACNLLNVPQRYLVRKPLDVFVAQADRQSFNSQLLEIKIEFAQACEIALSSPRELTENNYAIDHLIKNWEVHFQPRQGEPIPVTLSVSATCDSQNHLKRLLWIVQDLRPSK